MLANTIDPNQTVPKEGVQTIIQTELHLNLATLLTNLADNKMMILFPENRL